MPCPFRWLMPLERCPVLQINSRISDNSLRHLKITIITKKATRRFQWMLITCFERRFLVVTVKNTRLALICTSLFKASSTETSEAVKLFRVEIPTSYLFKVSMLMIKNLFKSEDHHGLNVITDRKFNVVLVRLESSIRCRDFRALVLVVSSARITRVRSCIIAAVDKKVHASDLS